MLFQSLNKRSILLITVLILLNFNKLTISQLAYSFDKTQFFNQHKSYLKPLDQKIKMIDKTFPLYFRSDLYKKIQNLVDCDKINNLSKITTNIEKDLKFIDNGLEIKIFNRSKHLKTLNQNLNTTDRSDTKDLIQLIDHISRKNYKHGVIWGSCEIKKHHQYISLLTNKDKKNIENKKIYWIANFNAPINAHSVNLKFYLKTLCSKITLDFTYLDPNNEKNWLNYSISSTSINPQHTDHYFYDFLVDLFQSSLQSKILNIGSLQAKILNNSLSCYPMHNNQIGPIIWYLQKSPDQNDPVIKEIKEIYALKKTKSSFQSLSPTQIKYQILQTINHLRANQGISELTNDLNRHFHNHTSYLNSLMHPTLVHYHQPLKKLANQVFISSLSSLQKIRSLSEIRIIASSSYQAIINATSSSPHRKALFDPNAKNVSINLVGVGTDLDLKLIVILIGNS